MTLTLNNCLFVRQPHLQSINLLKFYAIICQYHEEFNWVLRKCRFFFNWNVSSSLDAIDIIATAESNILVFIEIVVYD